MNNPSDKMFISQVESLAINQVLKNTYALLGLTILFSSLTATLTMFGILPSPGMLGIFLCYGLLYLVHANANSSWGLVATFAFTGFMGMSLGPLFNAVIGGLANGHQIVGTALGATGFIFLTLSAYTISSGKSFNYLGGMLFAGIISGIMLSLAAFLFQIPALQLGVSMLFVLLSSGLIMFHTSEIIHGGERNYILATISLYIAMYNLLVSLMHILVALAGDRD